MTLFLEGEMDGGVGRDLGGWGIGVRGGFEDMGILSGVVGSTGRGGLTA